MSDRTFKNLATSMRANALLLGASALSLVAETAQAQETNDDVRVGLDTIVVTAQKREENIQDVPISITAFTADKLEKSGIRELADIALATPNVNYDDGSSLKLNGITIRGIRSSLKTAAVDSATAIYVDEVYQNSRVGSTFDLYDVERVEVLRGPQGTLFGRNSVAGAISVTTRKPSDEFYADATLTAGNYGLRNVRANVNVPLTENVFFKLSATYLDRDGYESNIFNNSDVNDEERWGIRGQLRFLPTDNSDFMLTYEHREQSGAAQAFDVSAYNLGQNPADGSPLNALAPFANPPTSVLSPQFPGVPTFAQDEEADGFDRRVNLDFPNFEELTKDQISLMGVIDLGFSELTTITAYNRHKYDTAWDFDLSPFPILTNGDPEEVTSVTQELRLSGASDRLTWTAGVMYYYQDSKNEAIFTVFPLAAEAIALTFVQPLESAVRAQLSALPIGETVTTGEIELNSYAAYGQISYAFNDIINLDLGGRYTYEEKDFDYSQDSPIGNQVIGGLPQVDPLSDSEKWSAFTPAATLRFTWTDDVMTYLTASNGFKSGGFNDDISSGNATADSRQYDQEEIWNYEIGFKATFFDNRFLINGAAFLMDWRDRQGAVREFDTNGSGSTIQVISTASVGDIESKGFEIEFAAAPFERLIITGGYGTYEAEVVEEAISPVTGLPVIEEGTKLVSVPDYNASLGLQYTHPLNGFGELVFVADYNYRGDETITEALNDTAGAEQEAFGLFNARLQLTPGKGRWSFGLWGRNLTDEDYIAYQFNTLNGLPGINSLAQVLGAPRTYGADLRINF